MDWLQVLTIAASTWGCCLYFRRETKEQIKEIQAEQRYFHECMKDFHGRLCILEERHLQIMQKMMEDKK